jgi:hypothetical protein
VILFLISGFIEAENSGAKPSQMLADPLEVLLGPLAIAGVILFALSLASAYLSKGVFRLFHVVQIGTLANALIAIYMRPFFEGSWVSVVLFTATVAELAVLVYMHPKHKSLDSYACIAVGGFALALVCIGDVRGDELFHMEPHTFDMRVLLSYVYGVHLTLILIWSWMRGFTTKNTTIPPQYQPRSRTVRPSLSAEAAKRRNRHRFFIFCLVTVLCISAAVAAQRGIEEAKRISRTSDGVDTERASKRSSRFASLAPARGPSPSIGKQADRCQCD